MSLQYSKVAVGDLAPDFTLPTETGEPLTLSSLRGQRVVLYFYPKDSTPGCTVEACEFRDLFPRFRRDGVTVIGVAPGTLKSKAKFKQAQGLPFTLLNDEQSAVCDAYGVWREKMLYGRTYMGVMRTTYVIGPDGRVEAVWEKVNHEGHAAEVHAFIRGDAAPAAGSPKRAAAKKAAAKRPAAKRPAAKAKVAKTARAGRAASRK